MAVKTVQRMDPDHIMEWLDNEDTPIGDTIVYYTGSCLSRDRADFEVGHKRASERLTGVYRDTTFGNACSALHTAAKKRKVCLTQRKLGPEWYDYQATMRRRHLKKPRGDYPNG